MSSHHEVLKKIQTRKAIVGVIGMGYVGSPLADLVIHAGYKAIGFVRQQHKADSINGQNKKNLFATIDKSQLKSCDIILICVQTPIHEDKKPDLTFLKNATEQIADHLRPGQLIIIESSIAPGTTRNIVLPILSSTNMRVEKDFFLCFSPERVDPGNKHFTLNQIPKVVAGFGPNSHIISVAFYKTIIDTVVPVSSLETAELVKIFENTYRLVNISLVNEVMQYANAIGVDMWEVVDAASTKPFGFHAHYPGPGIGGHCIPVDPYYLVDDAMRKGVDLRLVREAGNVNDLQPERVVSKAMEILHKYNGVKTNHKVLLVGISYKPDIDDVRESPALKVWDLFKDKGVDVSYHDPYISSLNGTTSLELSDVVINDHDVIIITTNHGNIDYKNLAKSQKPIIDTRNVYKKGISERIYRL